MFSIIFALALTAAPGGCEVLASVPHAPFRYELVRCASSDAGVSTSRQVRLCAGDACLVEPCGHHPSLPPNATDLERYGDLEDLRPDPAGVENRWLLTFRGSSGGDESFAYLTQDGQSLRCEAVPGLAEARARAEKLLRPGDHRGACGADIVLADVHLQLLEPIDGPDDEPCAGSRGVLAIDARFTRTGLELVRARRLTRAQADAQE